MVTANRTKIDVQTGEETSIHIVPPHTLELEERALAAGAAAGAKLTYRGGPLMTRVQVFTIYWGAQWASDAGSALVQHLNEFFSSVVASPLLDQLGEYSVAGQTIARGTYIGTTTVVTSTPRASIADSRLQKFLQQLIASKKVPQPTPNTLYFIYLPTGTSVRDGKDRSCKVFCGYHHATSSNVYYAVMPYPDCVGCRGSLSLADALTSTSSHELCEAITDPVPGTGWYDDGYGEIGDICPWKTKKLGKYVVQLEWSNTAGMCV